RRIGIEQFSATPLEPPAVEAVPASLRITRSRNATHFLPPQYGADAGKQLPEVKRLYDIVVGTKFEADDAIDFIGPVARHDDDWYVRLRTNFSQEIEPIILTQPQVKDDQAGREPRKKTAKLGSAGCRSSRNIVFFQISDHHLP